MDWSWRWIPDPPQHFGDNPLFDTGRLAVVLLAIWLTLSCGRVLLEQRRRSIPFTLGQSARFVSLGLGLWYIAGTEMAVFGTAGTPRLLLAMVVTLSGLYGVHKMRNEQRADPPVR